jgi:CRP/FNR family cyclic AMP-dependent transcriptional regulator
MDSFWGNIFRRKAGQDGTGAILKQIPLFADLDARELAAIRRILYRREYAAGEVIFRQGDPGVGMYIVEHGLVSIVYEPTGKLLAELQDGEFFGEIALLNETPRSALARAKTASTLLGLFQPDLLGLIKRNPQLGIKVLLPLAQIAGMRLIRADQEVRALSEEVARLKVETEEEHRDGAHSRVG